METCDTPIPIGTSTNDVVLYDANMLDEWNSDVLRYDANMLDEWNFDDMTQKRLHRTVQVDGREVWTTVRTRSIRCVRILAAPEIPGTWTASVPVTRRQARVPR